MESKAHLKGLDQDLFLNQNGTGNGSNGIGDTCIKGNNGLSSEFLGNGGEEGMGRGSDANDSISQRDAKLDSFTVWNPSEGVIQEEIAEFTVIELAHGMGQEQFEDSNSHLAIHRFFQPLVEIRDSDAMPLAENPQSEFCGFPIPGLKHSGHVQDIRRSESTLLNDPQSLQGGDPLQDFTGRSASQANELEKGKRLT
jgi:hypothetical protein